VKFALHHALIRKIVGVSAAAMTITAPGLLLAAAPASAAVVAVAPACESHGNFCAGAPNLASGDPVQETQAGRTIDFASTGTSGTSYLLEVAATNTPGGTLECIAASNADNFGVLHPCNGGSAVVWKAELGPDGQSCLFDNQKFAGSYLAGKGTGSQFEMVSGAVSGPLKQFKLTTGASGTGTVTLPAVNTNSGLKVKCGA
jgi:hypothetical protein